MLKMAMNFTQTPTMAVLSKQAQRTSMAVPLSRKFTCSSSSSSSSSSSRDKPRKLILYSKPGCCLCDGLKEKLDAAFSLSSSGPDSLHEVDLQIRDITTNSNWERAYQYEIPVLAKLRPDGTEEILPRLSPRVGVELVQRKIADAFRQ